MRRAVTPVIPPSLYRHFAIITVLFTASLAMFAEGESREAQPVSIARPEPAEPPASIALATGSPPGPDQWGVEADIDNGFGRPMEGFLGGGDSSSIPDLDEMQVPGYSPEYLASLSEEERELLLAGLQENGMLAPDIQRRRRAALSAASSRRSGTASSGD